MRDVTPWKPLGQVGVGISPLLLAWYPAPRKKGLFPAISALQHVDGSRMPGAGLGLRIATFFANNTARSCYQGLGEVSLKEAE